jgi:hypothetical protein
MNPFQWPPPEFVAVRAEETQVFLAAVTDPRTTVVTDGDVYQRERYSQLADDAPHLIRGAEYRLWTP